MSLSFSFPSEVRELAHLGRAERVPGVDWRRAHVGLLREGRRRLVGLVQPRGRRGQNSRVVVVRVVRVRVVRVVVRVVSGDAHGNLVE